MCGQLRTVSTAARLLTTLRATVRRRTSPAAEPGPSGSERLKILLVEAGLGDDGAARSNVRLADRWGAAGADVSLFVLQRPRSGRAPAFLKPGVEPVYPAKRPLRLRWVIVWGLLKSLPAALRADVVVAGREIGWGLVVARVASRLTRRPLVAMIRSDPRSAIDHYVSRRLRPLSRWSLRTADRVICISSGLVPAVRALGIEPSRITVVLNGVEVPRITSAATAALPELPGGDGPLVLGIGRLEHQKGFDLLVRAHARVVGAGVPHRLLLLGEGRERSDLADLAATLGVSSSVHMPGFWREPLPVLAESDLFCLPSRWEGFGQSLAEALILGTPTVAADCVSGPREILRDGAFGDLVPVDDVTALATAIEAHLRAPGRLRDAARAGQAWAVTHLDVGRTADEMLDVLRAVAAGR